MANRYHAVIRIGGDCPVTLLRSLLGLVEAADRSGEHVGIYEVLGTYNVDDFIGPDRIQGPYDAIDLEAATGDMHLVAADPQYLVDEFDDLATFLRAHGLPYAIATAGSDAGDVYSEWRPGDDEERSWLYSCHEGVVVVRGPLDAALAAYDAGDRWDIVPVIREALGPPPSCAVPPFRIVLPPAAIGLDAPAG